MKRFQKLTKDQKKVVKVLIRCVCSLKSVEHSIEEGEVKYTNTDVDYIRVCIKKGLKLLGMRKI